MLRIKLQINSSEDTCNICNLFILPIKSVFILIIVNIWKYRLKNKAHFQPSSEYFPVDDSQTGLIMMILAFRILENVCLLKCWLNISDDGEDLKTFNGPCRQAG